MGCQPLTVEDTRTVKEAFGERFLRFRLGVGLQPQRKELLAGEEAELLLINSELQHLIGERCTLPLARRRLMEGVYEQQALRRLSVVCVISSHPLV